MAEHPTMTDQPTGMTDRALLESLYLFVDEKESGLHMVERGGTHLHFNGLTLEEYVSQDEFWIELDNALAARGWHSQLDRVLDPKLGNIYRYKADKGAESFGSFWKDSRNSATREVYEKVFNNKEIEAKSLPTEPE